MIAVVQTVQIFVLLIILGALSFATLQLLVKYKIFREVYEGNPKKYLDSKILEKQFQINRAMGLNEEKK